MGSKAEQPTVIIRHGTQDYATRVTDNPEEYVEAHRDVHANDKFIAFVAPRAKARVWRILLVAALAVGGSFLFRLLMVCMSLSHGAPE